MCLKVFSILFFLAFRSISQVVAMSASQQVQCILLWIFFFLLGGFYCDQTFKNNGMYINDKIFTVWPRTVAINELLCMKNAGAQIAMDFS